MIFSAHHPSTDASFPHLTPGPPNLRPDRPPTTPQAPKLPSRRSGAILATAMLAAGIALGALIGPGPAASLASSSRAAALGTRAGTAGAGLGYELRQRPRTLLRGGQPTREHPSADAIGHQRNRRRRQRSERRRGKRALTPPLLNLPLLRQGVSHLLNHARRGRRRRRRKDPQNEVASPNRRRVGDRAALRRKPRKRAEAEYGGALSGRAPEGRRHGPERLLLAGGGTARRCRHVALGSGGRERDHSRPAPVRHGYSGGSHTGSDIQPGGEHVGIQPAGCCHTLPLRRTGGSAGSERVPAGSGAKDRGERGLQGTRPDRGHVRSAEPAGASTSSTTTSPPTSASEGSLLPGGLDHQHAHRGGHAPGGAAALTLPQPCGQRSASAFNPLAPHESLEALFRAKAPS